MIPKNKIAKSVKDILDKIEEKLSKTNSLANYLRQRYLRIAFKADYKKSRAAAVKLHCLECGGGQRIEAKECPRMECFLWPYRTGSYEKRPTLLEIAKLQDALVKDPKKHHKYEHLNLAEIPTEDYYTSEIEDSITEAQRENGKRLSSMKKDVD